MNSNPQKNVEVHIDLNTFINKTQGMLTSSNSSCIRSFSFLTTRRQGQAKKRHLHLCEALR